MNDNASPGRTIDRLLRSAAHAKDESPIGMPFGFDTRVLALAHKGTGQYENYAGSPGKSRSTWSPISAARPR